MIRLSFVISSFLFINVISECADKKQMHLPEDPAVSSISNADLQCKWSDPSELVDGSSVVFEAAMLKRVAGKFTRFTSDQSDKEKLSVIVKCLCLGLNAAQTKLLMNLFVKDKQIADAKRDKTYVRGDAEKCVNTIEDHHLGWLANRAREYDLSLYDPIIARIAGDPKFAFRLYQTYEITDAVSQEIANKINRSSLHAAIVRRLAKEVPFTAYGDIRSVFCNKKKNADQLFIEMSRGLAVYDILHEEVMDNRSLEIDKESSSLLFGCCDTSYRYYCTINGGQLDIWNTNDKKKIKQLEFCLDDSDHILHAGFNNAGTQLFVLCKDKVCIYDMNTEQSKEIAVSFSGASDVRYSDDDTRLMIQKGGDLLVYNVNDGHQKTILEHVDGKVDVVYSEDASKLMLLNNDARLRLYNLAARNEYVDITPNLRQNEWIISRQFCDNDTILIYTNLRMIKHEISKDWQSIVAYPLDTSGSMYGKLVNTEKALLEVVEHVDQWKRTHKVIAYPHVVLRGLDMAQMRLLFKALDCWQKDKQYRLERDEEMIYESLSGQLQADRLFAVAE